jgi:hypothetical protein
MAATDEIVKASHVGMLSIASTKKTSLMKFQ